MDYEYLQFMEAGGFQESDKTHPTGKGQPGYRVAFKTLKIIPTGGFQMEWPNLRIQFLLKKTDTGGIKTKGALQSRRPNMTILPEYIDEKYDNGKTQIKGRINMKFEFQSWTEEIDDSGVIEMLYLTRATKPVDVLEEGRLHLAKMKTMFELTEGSRLLGIPLVEEVVEIFPDWHWNRNMRSILVGTESELDMIGLDTRNLLNKIESAVSNLQDLPSEDAHRLNLSSSWFWKAEQEADSINRLIEYWISIEALEMPNTTNITPIRKKLAQITGRPESDWTKPVGVLATIRSELVHGERDKVEYRDVQIARYLALTLLSERLFPGEKSVEAERLELLIFDDK